MKEIVFSSGLGRNARTFDDDEVLHLLRALVEREGNQTAVAKRYDIDRPDLNAVLNGRRGLGDSLPKAFGFRKVYVLD